MDKHNNDRLTDKNFEFGAHFRFSNLCERLIEYSNTPDYQERVKEILIEEKTKYNKNKNLNTFLKKSELSKVSKLYEFMENNNKMKNNVNESNLKKSRTLENDLKFLKIGTKNTINNKSNIRKQIANNNLFPDLLEMNQKKKRSFVHLAAKDLNLKSSLNKNFFPKSLNIPFTKGDYNLGTVSEKMSLIHMKNNRSLNLNEKIVLKIKLPIIKK